MGQMRQLLAWEAWSRACPAGPMAGDCGSSQVKCASTHNPVDAFAVEICGRTRSFGHFRPSFDELTPGTLWAKTATSPDFAQTPLRHSMGETDPNHPFRPYLAHLPLAPSQCFMGENSHIHRFRPDSTSQLYGRNRPRPPISPILGASAVPAPTALTSIVREVTVAFCALFRPAEEQGTDEQPQDGDEDGLRDKISR